MIPIGRRNEIGNGLNPKISASGVKGKINVLTTIDRVAIKRYFPGRLLKEGFRLLITSTIKEAETTDSRNQPVLN
jgi:hypothetical protein